MCHPEAAAEHTASVSTKCARDVGREQEEGKCQRDTWEGQGGIGGAEFCRSRTFEEWEISFQKKQCLMFKDFFFNLY